MLKIRFSVQDITSVIKETAEFFGKSYSDAEVAGLADHLSVDSMRGKLYVLLTFGRLIAKFGFQQTRLATTTNWSKRQCILTENLMKISGEMQANKTVAGRANLSIHRNFRFIRKGAVGSFKEELNDGYIKRFDTWITNSLRNTDFKFREMS
jgi:hypothetical protein